MKKGGRHRLESLQRMPRSFLVKKKQRVCGAWQWKEPEHLEWKAEDVVGKFCVNIDIYVQMTKISIPIGSSKHVH